MGRLVLAAIALAALAFTLRDLDVPATLALVRGLGPWVALVLVPYGVATTLDTLGWRRLLRAAGGDAPLATLWRARVGSDAVLLTVVGGPIVAESVVPLALAERAGVPVPVTVASLALRRRFLFAGNGLYLLLGLAVGAPTLAAVSRALLGSAVLVPVAAGFGVALVTAGVGLGVVLARGRVGTRLLALLERVPIARLRAWLAREGPRFVETDTRLAARLAPAEAARALPFFVGAWLAEAVETFTILTLLGAGVAPSAAAVTEMSMSLLRSLVFMVPAGLGVQDVGYTAFLRALTVARATEVAAAFVLLKRLKEVTWVLVGYALLGGRARTSADRRSDAGEAGERGQSLGATDRSSGSED